jgi:thiamine pyrophosphokinase
MSHVVVVIGGGELAARAVDAVPRDAVIIAADSGLDHAVTAGMRPDSLVGDLDSISAGGRMWAYAHGLDIDEHPVEKDATDTELALEAAAAVPDATHLLVLGGAGDRVDHLLGTLLALGNARLAHLQRVRAIIGSTQFVVVHAGHRVTLPLEPDDLFSVLALHGPADGVTLTGAKWELNDAHLDGTESLGVSNIAKERTVIDVTTGVVTVVIP